MDGLLLIFFSLVFVYSFSAYLALVLRQLVVAKGIEPIVVRL